MKVFFDAILIVFCSLLGSAFSVQCYGCLAINSTVCDEKTIECVGDRCMTVSQIYKHANRKFTSMFKGCGNTTLCGAYGSLTQDTHVKIRTYVSCCEGTTCNTDKFYIPAEDTKPNGVKCPSSYCEGTTMECKEDLKIMECRGNETNCLDYRGRIRDPDFYENDYSLKCCINKLGCKENFKCLVGVLEIKNVKLKC